MHANLVWLKSDWTLNSLLKFCSKCFLLVDAWENLWVFQGFPVCASSKEPCCQCRRHKRHGFDPCLGKIPWKRTWQPTPAFLPGESWIKDPGRLQSRGLQRVRHNQSDLPHTYILKLKNTHTLLIDKKHRGYWISYNFWMFLFPKHIVWDYRLHFLILSHKIYSLLSSLKTFTMTKYSLLCQHKLFFPSEWSTWEFFPWDGTVHVYAVTQLCLILCNPMDCGFQLY